MKFEFLKKIGNSIANSTGPARLKVKAVSPEILLGLGIATMTGAVVSAVVAGRKNDKILDEHFVKLEDAKTTSLVTEDGTEVVKTPEQVKREVRHVYLGTAGSFVKNYALTAGFMTASVGCFVGMHNIQAGRIAGLTTAYTGLREYISRYESNNIKLNGQESHELCKYGFKKVQEQDEDGYTVEKTVMKKPEDNYRNHPYMVVLDSTNSGLNDNPSTDILMLKNVEDRLRMKVADQGWATVNDVLEMLGAERMTSGMVMGWIKGGNTPMIGWDASVNNLLLANHYDYGDVVLEFNIDGNVYDLLKKREKAQKELTKRLAEKGAERKS